MARPSVNISKEADFALNEICNLRDENKGDYINKMIIKEYERDFEELQKLRDKKRLEAVNSI